MPVVHRIYYYRNNLGSVLKDLNRPYYFYLAAYIFVLPIIGMNFPFSCILTDATFEDNSVLLWIIGYSYGILIKDSGFDTRFKQSHAKQ